MAKKEPVTITDPNYRIHNPKLEKALKEHEEENLRLAEKKEKELLERPTPVLDAFMNGVDKISKLLAKKKKNNKIEAIKKRKSENVK